MSAYASAKFRAGSAWDGLPATERRSLVVSETESRLQAMRGAGDTRRRRNTQQQREQRGRSATPFQKAKQMHESTVWDAMSAEDKRLAVAFFDSSDSARAPRSPPRAKLPDVPGAALLMDPGELTSQLGTVASEVRHMQNALAEMQSSAEPQLAQLRAELSALAAGSASGLADAVESELRQRKGSSRSIPPPDRGPRPPVRWGAPPRDEARADVLRSELRLEERISELGEQGKRKATTFWAVVVAVILIAVLRLVILPLVFHGEVKITNPLPLLFGDATGDYADGDDYDPYLDQPMNDLDGGVGSYY